MEVDLSNLDLNTRRKVDEIFRRDFDLKVFKAIKRQTAIAARNELSRPRSRDGVGSRTHEVDAFIDSLWRQLYGHDYSANEDLVKFLTRRNPEIRVRSTGGKIQAGYTPGTKSWFRKKYELNSKETKV